MTPIDLHLYGFVESDPRVPIKPKLDSSISEKWVNSAMQNTFNPLLTSAWWHVTQVWPQMISEMINSRVTSSNLVYVCHIVSQRYIFHRVCNTGGHRWSVTVHSNDLIWPYLLLTWIWPVYDRNLTWIKNTSRFSKSYFH